MLKISLPCNMAFARFKNMMFERCDQGGAIEAAEARSDIVDIEY